MLKKLGVLSFSVVGKFLKFYGKIKKLCHSVRPLVRVYGFGMTDLIVKFGN